MLLLIAALAALAPTALGEPETPKDILNPDWLEQPSAEDVAHYYPTVAVEKEIDGRVTISCTVSKIGRLDGCVVVEEAPTGSGFGEAAVNMALAKFRMRPQVVDGRAVGGAKVRIPIRFSMPKSPSLDTALRCYGAGARSYEADPKDDRASIKVAFWAMMSTGLSLSKEMLPAAIERSLTAARTAAPLSDLEEKGCDTWMTMVEEQSRRWNN